MTSPRADHHQLRLPAFFHFLSDRYYNGKSRIRSEMDIAAKCLHSLPHIGKPDARMLIFADLRSVIFYQKLVKSRMLP